MSIAAPREYVTRNPKLAWREIDGEVVIISPEDSHVHELNETAAAIWTCADGDQTVDQIAGKIAAEYDVTPDAARSDVVELVELLTQKNLLFVRVERA
jgi:hypothetical protein